MYNKDVNWKSLNLNNKIRLPARGLGLHRLRNCDTLHVILDEALSLGYRLFDVGVVGGNERNFQSALKTAMRKHDLRRDDIFIMCRLPNSEMGCKSRVSEALNRSVDALDFEYFDICLVQSSENAKAPKNRVNGKAKESTWAGLVELYEKGDIDTIGVCNYTADKLSDLLSSRNPTTPALNQIEMNPLNYDKQLIAYCQSNDIVVQGYHSFQSSKDNGFSLLKAPEVISVAKEVQVSPAQVLLVWTLQKQCGIIPKSSQREHVRENYELNFTLDTEQISILDNMSETKNGNTILKNCQCYNCSTKFKK